MSADMRDFGIDQLSIADRLGLVEQIWDSIAAVPSQEIPVTPSQKADLDARLADLEANPDAGREWEEVKARLRGQ